jgi:hypothetical protein
MLVQDLAHERQIRIDNGRPQRLGVLETLHFNGAPYGVGVHVQACAIVPIFQCSA